MPNPSSNTPARLQEVCRRLWERDPSLWKEEPAHQASIRNRLGWLDAVETMRPRLEEIRAFADEARGAGFRQALLLGMGGSSLCPEVLRETFGVADGYLDVQVLDSTDPAQIAAMERRLDLERTLFIVASKSGGTTEVASLYAYFSSRVPDGKKFVAITDPGTSLEKLAAQAGFRRVFSNPPDIGGRYSALSYFGLVPAALLGIDIGRLLSEAQRAADECRSCDAPPEQSGLRLGPLMAKSALVGRDKLTLILPPELTSLGSWIEQLVAESTGKEGKGVLPVDGEPLGKPEAYGHDRLFLYVRYPGEHAVLLDEAVSRLERSQHPVIRIDVPDLHAVGAEFFRWEVATAVAGAYLGVNPFDEPNVQESKDLTRELLGRWREDGKFPAEPPVAGEEMIRVYADDRFRDLPRGAVRDALQVHFTWSQPGDYAAFLAYLPRTEEIERELQAMRVRVRDRRHLATTVGFGPRFLHSTGQFHKGGPDHGVFLQITCDDREDLPIPGEPYGFSVLKQAQALGDWKALRRHGRRAIRCHLTGDTVKALRRLREHLEAVV